MHILVITAFCDHWENVSEYFHIVLVGGAKYGYPLACVCGRRWILLSYVPVPLPNKVNINGVGKGIGKLPNCGEKQRLCQLCAFA